MNLIQAIILGIVEGITEFLPISSTGHLILISSLFGIENSSFTKSFEIAIQLGAILSVVFLYRNKIFKDKETFKKVIIAFIPTAVLGLIFYKIMKNYLLSNKLLVILSLLIGGIFLIIFEIWHKNKESKEINYKKSFIIGIAQSISIIPGVSRSAATIISGLIMGINRKTIVEFSFLLAVPTMFAATIFDLLKNFNEFTISQFHLLIIGFIVSFFVALLSIKWLLKFIENHTFILFGIYRIIIAVMFYLFFY